eukprot:4405955-Pyramimonas_sp.AAC.1
MGLRQNVGKQETLPICCGKGGHRHEQLLHQQFTLQGRILVCARYLGVRVSARFAVGQEIQFRLLAGKTAWKKMGQFWTSSTPL